MIAAYVLPGSSLVIVGACLFTGVCGLAVGAPEEASITLYYWGNEGDTLAPDLLQGFEAMHDGSDGQPAIRVIMGQSASVNRTDDPQRLLCAVAGGEPPDVVFFDRFAVGEWAARGAFRSLQDLYDRDIETGTQDPFTLREGDFYPPCWAEACYDGELFAVPLETDNRALYYNTDLLEKHGDALIAAGCVDPDRPGRAGPPRTWEQLLRAAEILTERDERGRLMRVGFIPNYGNSWLYIYGWLNGGRFMSEDGRTCTLNAPEIVDALAFMTSIYDLMGGARAVSAFQSSQEGADLDPFLAGKIAMRIDGNAYLESIANLRRDMRFGVTLAPAPEGKRRLGWCGGWSLVIPAGAAHPEEAWELIKYMASRPAYVVKTEAMRQQARAAGNIHIPLISARRDITEWAMEHYLYEDPTIDEQLKEGMRVFVENLPASKYRPVTPVGQLLWNEQVRALEAGIFRRYDPDDPGRNAKMALDKGTAVVQKALDAIYKPEEHPKLTWRPVVVGYLMLLMVVAGGFIWYFKRRLSGVGYVRQEYYAGYLFAAPWVIGFIVFGGGPIVFSLFMSFCKYDVFSSPEFVGLSNYSDMFFNDPLFYKSLGNTVFMALGVPLGMAVGLGIAMLLSHETKGMAVYRTVYYLPAIMPVVAAAILWRWIFNPEEGVLNAALQWVGLRGPAWLQDEHWSKPGLIVMGLWSAGGGMVVWLAGLKGIPKHLYEAAEIDGAGPLRRFWSVTLPMLSPYILFNLVMGLIGTFQIFTQAYVMTQGGPLDSTLFFAYALFNNAFRYMKMGYASAMAWVLFGIVLVLTLIQLRLAKRWVHYESES